LAFMPRQPRLVVPDVPLHIIQRGNDRMACFRQERDYLVYLALLLQVSEKFECTVHTYCLMTNHVHLLLTPGSPDGCSRLMHTLAHRYAQYFNREHKRTGTLWDGRYRSCLVQSSSYVLACYRYIELNPVRAGMVSHPNAYPWSSHAANSGVRTDPLVSPHPEFIALAPGAYFDLIATAVEPALLLQIRDATNSGYPLATASFKSALGTITGRKTAQGRRGGR
jgi:putative transposase